MKGFSVTPLEAHALLEYGAARLWRECNLWHYAHTGQAFRELTSTGAVFIGSVSGDEHIAPYPCGTIGDRRWVRETWAHDAPDLDTLRRSVESDGAFCGPYYKADARDFDKRTLKWRSPALMPQWASRMVIEVADLRIEKVRSLWNWAIDVKKV